MSILRFPVPKRKPRNGLIGLRSSNAPGEVLALTVSLLRREAHLRELAHRPDRYLSDLGDWIERQTS